MYLYTYVYLTLFHLIHILPIISWGNAWCRYAHVTPVHDDKLPTLITSLRPVLPSSDDTLLSVQAPRPGLIDNRQLMVPYSRLLFQASPSSSSPITLLPYHVWHTLLSLYHPTRIYSSNHSELPCTVHIPRPLIRSGDKVEGCIYPIELRIHWYSTAGQVRTF